MHLAHVFLGVKDMCDLGPIHVRSPAISRHNIFALRYATVKWWKYDSFVATEIPYLLRCTSIVEQYEGYLVPRESANLLVMWQQWSVNVVKNPVLLPFSYTRRYFDANLIAKIHQPKRLEVTAHLIGFACDWNRKV